MSKNHEKDGDALSAISVVSSNRSEPDSPRKPRRGLSRSALEAGQSATDAINAARAQTERYKTELDEQRVRCGQASDALRDLQEHVQARGAASPLPYAFTMPPDPLTAEILKRDAVIASWSGAYRTVAEAAARDREDAARERAKLLATIADRDQALKAAARSADADRAAAKSRIADALKTVPSDITAELDALRLAAATHDAHLASAQDRLGVSERAAESLRKDIHYYVFQAQKAQQGELNARSAELKKQAENLRLSELLAQARASATGPEQPLPSALLYQPASDLAGTDPGTSTGLAELEEQLGVAFSEAAQWDLDQRTPLSGADHLSRSSSSVSQGSRHRRHFSPSPVPSSDSRGARRRT